MSYRNMSDVPCFLYGKLLVRETCNSNIQIICQEYVLLKYLLLMYVRCLAQGLARNSEIKFFLPSLRANNSNQMKIKDSGCQFMCTLDWKESSYDIFKCLLIRSRYVRIYKSTYVLLSIIWYTSLQVKTFKPAKFDCLIPRVAPGECSFSIQARTLLHSIQTQCPPGSCPSEQCWTPLKQPHSGGGIQALLHGDLHCCGV